MQEEEEDLWRLQELVNIYLDEEYFSHAGISAHVEHTLSCEDLLWFPGCPQPETGCISWDPLPFTLP